MDNLILSNLRQRPMRTAVSITGVSLGVILVVLTVGLARGMMRDSAQRQSRADAEIRFFPPGVMSSLTANPLTLPAAYADAIVNGVQPTEDNPDVVARPPVPGVVTATPVGSWVQSTVASIGFEVVDGIEYDTFVRATPLTVVEGRPIGDGRAPGAGLEALIDRVYAETTRDLSGGLARVGSKISVLGHEFTVVGIYEPSVLSRIKIPLHTMQQLFGGVENCTYIMVKVERPEMTDEVISTIHEFYPGHSVFSRDQLPALYSQSIRPLEIFLNVVISLAVVISTLVILLAMYTTIIERTREIGILKSMGATRRFIIVTIEKEAALISAFGVLLGFAVAVCGKYIIEANSRLVIDLQPRWLLISAIMGLACGIVGALYPAFRAANLDPVEALSYE